MSRFDYLKAVVVIEHDLAQALADEWLDLFDAEHRTGTGMHNAKVASVSIKADGRRTYVFEAWGEACERVTSLKWERWSKYLERVDIREERDVTQQGVELLYKHLMRDGAGGSNVTLYNSRKRQKVKGRDSGGFGIGIGSHKSDFRVTAYVRGGERGALELQQSGEYVKRAVRAVDVMRDSNAESYISNPWGAMLIHLRATGNVKMYERLGMDWKQLETTLEGIQPASSEVEQMLETIDKHLDRLPREALEDVMTTIQLKLM